MCKKIIFILLLGTAQAIFASSFSSSTENSLLHNIFIRDPELVVNTVNHLQQPDTDATLNRKSIKQLIDEEKINTKQVEELTLTQTAFLENPFLQDLFLTARVDEDGKATDHAMIDTNLLSNIQEKDRWLLFDEQIIASLHSGCISIDDILAYDLTPLAIELLYAKETRDLFLHNNGAINFNLLAQLRYIKIENKYNIALLKQLLSHRDLTVQQLIEIPLVALNFLVNPSTSEFCLASDQTFDFELLHKLNYFVIPEISNKQSFDNLLRILMSMLSEKVISMEQITSLSNLQMNILAITLSLHASNANPIINFKELKKINDASREIFTKQAIKNLLRSLIITPKQAIALSPEQVNKIETLASTPVQTLENLLKQKKITKQQINKYRSSGRELDLLTDEILQPLFFNPDGSINFPLLDSHAVRVVTRVILSERVRFLFFLGNITFEQFVVYGETCSPFPQDRVCLLTDPLTCDEFINDDGAVRIELLQNIALHESHHFIRSLLLHKQISLNDLIGIKFDTLLFLNYLIKVRGTKYLPVKADGMLNLEVFKAIPNGSFLKQMFSFEVEHTIMFLGWVVIDMLDNGQLTIEQIIRLSREQLRALSYPETRDLFYTAGRLDFKKLQHNPCYSIAKLEEGIPERIKRFMSEGRLNMEQFIALTLTQVMALDNEALDKLFIKSDGAIDFELLASMPALQTIQFTTLKRVFVSSLLRERKISFEQYGALNSLQLKALSNKQLINQLFIDQDNGREFVDVASIARIQNLSQLNILKTLNQNGLLSGRNENLDQFHFSFTQALELSDDFLVQVPNYIANVQNHSLTAEDCVAIAHEIREELRARDQLINNDTTRETTMHAEVHALTSYVLKKLKTLYGQYDNFNEDFRQIREYFKLITKQEEDNQFGQVLVLDSTAKAAEKIQPGIIILQQTKLNDHPALKAYWLGYHGYKTILELHDNTIIINDKPHIKNMLDKVQQLKSGIITDDPVMVSDLVVIFNISKKQHIAAANRCFERLTSHGCVKTMVYVWRAIHDKKLLLGSLEDALWQFTQGLCEIQRAHNHPDEGAFEFPDDLLKGGDVISCPTGTHNKLIEKLMQIHKVTADAVACSPEDLHLNAVKKFFFKTADKINVYLTNRAQSIKNLKNYKEKALFMQAIQLIEGVCDDRSVYDQEFKNNQEIPEIITINAIIQQELESIFDEYGELAYMNNRNNPNFAQLASAEYISKMLFGVTIGQYKDLLK